MEEKNSTWINFVLLGKTGSGKSASGNTILGRHAFISKKSPTSVTQDVEVQHGTIWGIPLTVYDTPEFYDKELSEDQIREKCQNVFSKCDSAAGHCAFLLVIKADRFTAEERSTVEKIEKLLGQNRLEKTWILFTRGDELEEKNMTIKEFIQQSPELEKLVKKYKNRYHVFNNKQKSFTQQVKGLLGKITHGMNKFISHFRRKKQTESISSDCVPERRLVLLGKTGVGKSATGSTILGEKCFKSDLSMNSVTMKSKMRRGCVADRNVCVIDTPGFFDPFMSLNDLLEQLANSIYLSSPGPHAFLIVLQANSRFSEQEEQLVELTEMIFGQEVSKYAMILFTHGDQLEGKSTEKLIEENSSLRELVQQCGGGYHVLNNKDLSNREQVTELMEKIDRMVEKNGGSCYSNQMFEKAQRCREEEEEKIKREEEQNKQAEEEKRQAEIENVKNETEERLKREMKWTEERVKRESTKTDGSQEGGSGKFCRYFKYILYGAAIGGLVGFGIGLLCGFTLAVAVVSGGGTAVAAVGGGGGAAAAAASAAAAVGGVGVAAAASGPGASAAVCAILGGGVVAHFTRK